jgi:pSer/pThr/pTyr-binding forkhead associated (FHA) protein
VVTLTASGYVVTDLNSSNGTRVNRGAISIGTVDVAFVIAADQVRSQ